MKKIIGMFVIVALAGLLGWQIYLRVVESRATNPGSRPSGGFPGAPGGRPGRPAVAVEIAEVRQQTIQDIGEFTGSLSAQSQFVVTPKVSGRLEQLLVNIGDRVKQGQLLAKLDDDGFQQDVAKTQADLEVARANLGESESALATAQREFERSKTLFQDNVLSQSKFEAAEAAYNAAVARQQVARATVTSRETVVKTAQLNLSYTNIKASWTEGNTTRVVGERFVDEGAMLRANDPIVSILDLRTIVCTIQVIERDYFRLEQGQQAIITTDALPGQTFTGQVARIAPLLKETSRQARVEIEIPNPDELLKPGMFVRVRLEFGIIENATVVPAAALITRNEQPGVFVADVQNLTAQFLPVTVGVTYNGLVQIIAPQLSGAVVTLGQHLLEDGSPIMLPQQAPAERKPGDMGERKPGQGKPPETPPTEGKPQDG